MANDIGQFFTVFMWAFRDRDMVLRILQGTAGGRMFYVNMRLGGLVRELPKGFEDKTLELLDYLEYRVKYYEDYLEKNPVFFERMKKVGILSKEDAIGLGVTGPVLRASGVNYDVRKNNPYYVYDKLNFEPQVRSEGDCFARYKVRMLEMRESMRLIRGAIKLMPEGDAVGMPIKLILPSAKNRISIVSRELPRGECMMYLVADPQKPYRLSIRAPSFINLAALGALSKGHKTADLFAILGSLDVIMGDVDK
jgi:NADH-quinone oxidoreductase subunit D